MCQAASLVNELAQHGACNEDMFAHSINSLYQIDAQSVADIYGGADGVKLGSVELEKCLSAKATANAQLIRYVVNLIHFERKLSKSGETQAALDRGVEQIVTQVDFFGPLAPEVIANIASLYSDTLGQWPQRIMIEGKPEYLEQADIMQKIRALLLAGLRSAIAWRQIGGRRWQLFFCRSRLMSNS
jgi:high frequency lysogenization protein